MPQLCGIFWNSPSAVLLLLLFFLMYINYTHTHILLHFLSYFLFCVLLRSVILSYSFPLFFYFCTSHFSPLFVCQRTWRHFPLLFIFRPLLLALFPHYFFLRIFCTFFSFFPLFLISSPFFQSSSFFLFLLFCYNQCCASLFLFLFFFLALRFTFPHLSHPVFSSSFYLYFSCVSYICPCICILHYVLPLLIPTLLSLKNSIPPYAVQVYQRLTIYQEWES